MHERVGFQTHQKLQILVTISNLRLQSGSPCQERRIHTLRLMSNFESAPSFSASPMIFFRAHPDPASVMKSCVIGRS